MTLAVSPGPANRRPGRRPGAVDPARGPINSITRPEYTNLAGYTCPNTQMAPNTQPAPIHNSAADTGAFKYRGARIPVRGDCMHAYALQPQCSLGERSLPFDRPMLQGDTSQASSACQGRAQGPKREPDCSCRACNHASAMQSWGRLGEQSRPLDAAPAYRPSRRRPSLMHHRHADSCCPHASSAPWWASRGLHTQARRLPRTQ